MKTFDAFNFAARLTQQSQQKKMGKTTTKKGGNLCSYGAEVEENY